MLTQPVRPPIVITARDHKGLMTVVRAALDTTPDVADYLMTELDRATLVEGDEIPDGLITMNSTVTYRDERTNEQRAVTLVYPGRANLAEGRLSVMTPVGAALIGLQPGQSIRWGGGEEESGTLTVVDVRHPTPEG